MVDAMGAHLANTMIGFHAFTGYDTTSAFYGKGKVRPFEIMQKSARTRRAISQLGEEWDVPDQVTVDLEEFVCQIYGTHETSANLARYKLFCAKSFGERKLPPTSDCLKLHIDRANYQARVHKLAVVPDASLPSPNEHGWIQDEFGIRVKWMTLDPAPSELTKSAKCGCKNSKCEAKSFG